MPAKRHDNPKPCGWRIPECIQRWVKFTAKKRGVKQNALVEVILQKEIDREKER